MNIPVLSISHLITASIGAVIGYFTACLCFVASGKLDEKSGEQDVHVLQ